MDPDSYPIEILHFLNPHLIWTEKKDTSPDFVFEQIGIFGLLPLKKVIGETGEVLTKKSEKWVLAINAVMKEFFDKYTEFYFLPIHIDRRSSIYNDNIHKFGDIYVLNQNKKIVLSAVLINSGFAEQDECEFYTKLYSGIIKTKLSTIESEKVVSAILEYSPIQNSTSKNKAFKKQTAITRAIKEIGNALSTKNVELHDRNQNLNPLENVSQLIEKKTRDLLLCKDELDVPLGRGCSRVSDSLSETSKNSLKSQSDSPKKEVINSKIQKLLEIERKKADPMEVIKKVEELSIRSLAKHNENMKIKSDIPINGMTYCLSHKFANMAEASDTTRKSDKIIKQDTDEEVWEVIKSQMRPVNRPTKQLVAFGPPMNDILDYKIKTKDEVEKNEEVVKKSEQVANNSEKIVKKYEQEAKKDEKEVNEVNRDEFSDKWDEEVDSNVNIKITNIDKLKVGVDSKVGKNNTLKELLHKKNQDKTGVVNKIDSQNSNVNFVDNKATAISKIDSLNTTVGFKKLKDRIAKHGAKTSVANQNTDVNIHDNNIESNSRESLKRLKDKIKSENKIVTNKINITKTECSDVSSNSSILVESERLIKSHYLKKMIKRKEMWAIQNLSTEVDKNETTVSAINCNNHETDSDDEIEKIKAQIISENGTVETMPKNDNTTEKVTDNPEKIDRNVNPFKNSDYSKSVFVDKLVSPVLMVHTKNEVLVLPHTTLQDIPLKNDIKHCLKKMAVKEPSRLQSVSWYYILKGHSIFMIGPAVSGKTLGYVPAICNAVMDDLKEIVSIGPICIIIAATARSVCEIAKLCQFFLGADEKVLACYHGKNMTDLTTSVLNGCEILVSTPPMLQKLLMMELGVDLKRLSILVLDDCERLAEVYESELKTIHYYVKQMYKSRANKSFKVQYVIASRLWCDFMRPLAKKAPGSIVSIVGFQECVLYSKASTSVEFFLQDNKVNSVKEFLNQIDRSKITVIVCRTDEEVDLLEKALSYHKSLFVCNDKMTLHDVHDVNVAWSGYKDSALGPILLCCDGNLTLLNVTDAHYLIHFSMPELFSMFCKRFAVLNDNYASIFNEKANEVKIKIMLDENNVEQLPKILNFIKRCTSEVPEALEEISRKVLEIKDYQKGEKLVPLCDSMLSLSECSDFWNCQERHAVLKDFDEPKEWVPRDGVITFKILHCHTAVTYSAKLLSHITKSEVKNYPTVYSTLSLKMGVYFSKESNRKLHGIPKIGDICAVAIQTNFFTRCKVVKILSYYKGNPHNVLINLIDEEKLETVKDVYLYHLPEEFKIIETYVVKVRLANIQPQDKDVTYSDLAKDQIKKIIDSDEHLYLRGEVVLTVGNTIFVNTLEACKDLGSMNETVVRHNLKTQLLESHAKPNPDHVDKLKNLCQIGGLEFKVEKPCIEDKVKVKRNYRWAFLPKDETVEVVFAGAKDPSTFFVVLTKFDKCSRLLISDIKKYVDENPKKLTSFEVGDIVLAEFPDDNIYERARIEEILESEVFCFFVDRGDFRDVSKDKIKYLPDNLIEQLPFQVIECRLIGVQPPATEWSEFSINWLCDMCLEDRENVRKINYLKYFTKEKSEFTDGNKYGVLLIDTNTGKELNINKMMIELNLAREIEDEIKFLDEPIVFEPEKAVDDEELIDIPEKKVVNGDNSLVPLNIKDNASQSDEEVKPSNKFLGRPIRSVPLVDENISDDDIDVNFSDNLVKAFGLNNFIGSRVLNNVCNTQTSDDRSQMKPIPSIKSGRINDYSKSLKDSSVHTDNVITDENGRNISETQKEHEEQSFKTKVDIINISHDSIDGNNKTNCIKLEIDENGTKTDDTLCNTSPVKRKSSLDDPKIVLDIEQLIPSKSNVFKMFANSKFGTKNMIDDLEIHAKNEKSELDSDDLSSTDVSQEIDKKIPETEPPRKPKLIWRQNINSVIIKIQLIGVENYSLEIEDQSIAFDCEWNDINYEFKIDLYGSVNVKKSKHANKGQYIQVNLEKLLKKNWISLTRAGKIKSWIVYDVDSIDTSSDEDGEQNDDGLEALKRQCEPQETDSDDDFDDDISFSYGKHQRY